MEARPVGTPEERFWAKVDKREPGECWHWTGTIFAGGYGAVSFDGVQHYAHRWIYERTVGAIPSGWDVDHTCHNRDLSCSGGRGECRHRRCVNPAHLEAVPHQVNSERGRTGAHNAVKTQCPEGHPYEGANLIIETSGSRRCRICRDVNMARFLERQDRPHRTLISYRGESKSIAGWARETGMSASVLAYRLRSGWALDDVFNPATRKRAEA